MASVFRGATLACSFAVVFTPSNAQSNTFEDILRSAPGKILERVIEREIKKKRERRIRKSRTPARKQNNFSLNQRKQIQRSLNQLGFNVGTIDGKLGKNSKRAIKRFQSKFGFPASGTLTQNQFSRLVEAASQKPTVAAESRTPPKNSQKLALPNGIWKGTYVCGQGLTGATLTFNHPSDRKGTARFEFYRAKNGPRVPNGSFRYFVNFDEKSRNLKLDVDRWIKRVSGFTPIDIKGRFDPSFRRFEGQVLHSACGAISLDLNSPNNITSAQGKVATLSQAEIFQAQRALNTIGFDVGEPDGKAGQQTQKGVRSFQRGNGFNPTGVLDEKQFSKLLEVAQKSKTGKSRNAEKSNLALLKNADFKGTLTERGSTYSVIVKVRDGRWQVDYRKFACGGRWKNLSATNSGATFQEEITLGKGRCLNNGHVELMEDGPRRYKMLWRKSARHSAQAKGRVKLLETTPDRPINTVSNAKKKTEAKPDAKLASGPQRKSFPADGGLVSLTLKSLDECGEKTNISVAAPNPGFFEEDGNGLSKLPDKIGSYVRTWCPGVKTINIAGTLAGNNVFSGELKFSSTWELSVNKTAVDFELEQLAQLPTNTTSLAGIEFLAKEASKKFGSDPVSMEKFSKAIQTKKDQIIIGYKPVVEKKASEIDISLSGFKRLKEIKSRDLSFVKQHAPDLELLFTPIFSAKEKEIEKSVVDEVNSKLATFSATWENAPLQLDKLARLESQYISDFPSLTANFASTKARIEEAVNNGFPAFVRKLDETDISWTGRSQLIADKNNLSLKVRKSSAYQQFIDAIEDHILIVETGLLTRSLAQIAREGAIVEDVPTILELAESERKEFESNRLNELAVEIDYAAAQRISDLVTSQLPAYVKKLKAMPINHSSLVPLKNAELEYSKLQGSIPEFSGYVTATQERVESIRTGMCKRAVETVNLSEDLKKMKIGSVGNIIGFDEFICRVDLAGNTIDNVSTSIFSSNINLEVRDEDGSSATYHLRPTTPDGSDEEILMANSISNEHGGGDLDQDEWGIIFARLIAPKPTGIPDSDGKTECDQMASVPDDPNRLSNPITLENLNLESALDACIVAVENRPQDGRSLFQLSRVLEAAGADGQAEEYLGYAAESEYPAALFKRAEQLSFDEKTLEKAVELFAKAKTLQHPQAAQKMNEITLGGMIDLTKTNPKHGTYKLSCLIEQIGRDGNKEVQFMDGGELKVTLDLDDKSVSFDYETIAHFRGTRLVDANKKYRLQENASEWSTRPNTMGRNGRVETLSITKNGMNISHYQSFSLGKNLFGREFWADVKISGSCFQSIG